MAGRKLFKFEHWEAKKITTPCQAKMRSLSEKRSETGKISHNLEGSGSNPLPAT